MLPRIFVSIANYRDSEAPHTIADVFEKAAFPERITVGVLDQIMPSDQNYSIDHSLFAGQVRRVVVDARESKGVCWARHRILTELRQDEDFVLQVDSHSRFSSNWDLRFIKMLKACPSPKSILTTYPVGYEPLDYLCPPCIPVMTGYKYQAPAILLFHTRTISMKDAPSSPIPGAFFGGSCVFAPSRAFDEVPYDPYNYFHGEEISMAARLWTNGWDIYAPNDVLMYHDYTTNRGRSRNWDDNMEWWPMANKSFARVRAVFGLETPIDPTVIENLSSYGLGNARSLSEYEAFADISLSRDHIGPRALNGSF